MTRISNPAHYLAMFGDYVMNHTDFAWLRAGIRSAAPGFAQVLVASQPGALRSLKARHPHPQGWITAELAFDGEKVSGTVTTPVAGEFRYGGKLQSLKPSANEIRLPSKR